MRPPRSPGPGPMSISRSAASITAGSCSTTTSVLPASRSRCIASTMRAHVARVQADRRLVEHEHRVDQRGAERGGEVDALHLAARQGAALAVERQVAEADVAQVLRGRVRISLEDQLLRLVGHARRAASARRRSAAAASIGSSIRSCRLSPGSASSCSRVQSTPAGMKRRTRPPAPSRATAGSAGARAASVA